MVASIKETSQELERQQLLRECHSLVALIGQSPYSIKLLKAARSALLLTAGYKAHRQTKD
jgi:hypothetical protein